MNNNNRHPEQLAGRSGNNNNNLQAAGKIPYHLSTGVPTLADYLPVILRGKWLILLIALPIFGGIMLNTLKKEPEYEATVSVMINTQPQRSPILTGLVNQGSQRMGNEIELLKSRSIAETVAQILLENRFLDKDSSIVLPLLTRPSDTGNADVILPLRSVAGRVRSMISFSPAQDADFIFITARSKNSEEAAILANAYAQVYYDRNFYQSRAQSRNVREFLESQLQEKQASLERAEQAMQTYMESQGIVLIDDNTKRIIENLTQLEAQREAVDVEIRSLTNTLSSLRLQLAEQEPNIARSIGSTDNPYIRMLQEQMAELEVQRDLTLSQNPEAIRSERYQHMLKEIEDQLELLRANLNKRTDEFMQSLTPGTTADPSGFIRQLRQRILEEEISLQGLQFRRAALTESLTRFERQFDRLPQVSMDYARLHRTRMSSEKTYLLIEQRYGEALITEQSEFGNVEIIDPALVPGRPTSVNLKFIILVALTLGFGSGIGVVILLDKLFAKVRVPEDLQKFGYDTLTTISNMNSDLKNVTSRNRIPKDFRLLDKHLITVSNPFSPTAESFRLLRTNIRFTKIDHRLRTMMVTSPSPGEGKSTIIANLAIAYAQSGMKTILIDADLRKPMLGELFDLPTEPGLTNVLAGELPLSKGIRTTVIGNLDLLPSGSLPTNPAELIGSQKMRRLVEILSTHYQTVLFDTPPVLAASDPLVLSTLTDGVLLIVLAGRTAVRELKHTEESLKRVDAKVLGVALNMFDYKRAYGSSYAYSYYRYGKYGYKAEGKSSIKTGEAKAQ